MAEYIGIDLHKQTSYVTKMDGRGKIKEQIQLKTNPESLGAYLMGLPSKAKIAVEATANWYYFYEMIEERGLDVTLSHPQKTRAIASARIKTDKIDSTILAHLLRCDLLPAAYIPPRPIRDLREVLRFRASLVSLRTQIKNKIKAVLLKNGLKTPTKTAFGVKSQRFLSEVSVRPCYRLALNGYLALLKHFNEQIDCVSDFIDQQAALSPEAQLLDTIPGVASYSALLILSEIGEIDRFPDAKHLCSYAGLVPSVYASGGKVRHGRLTKQGSKWLRWILIELSLHAVAGAPQFKSLYDRVMKKHGKNAAKVAVARAMLKTIYHMLKYKEPFKEMPVKKNTGQRPGAMA